MSVPTTPGFSPAVYRQIDHDEGGQERVNDIAGHIARAVAHLVVPLEIFLLAGRL
jgi:hypothetical protein